MDINSFDVSQATHYLHCSHWMNSTQGFFYWMPCVLLKKTKSGKAKIIVFGDRYRENTYHKKRIRYVDPRRLKESVK